MYYCRGATALDSTRFLHDWTLGTFLCRANPICTLESSVVFLGIGRTWSVAVFILFNRTGSFTLCASVRTHIAVLDGMPNIHLGKLTLQERLMSVQNVLFEDFPILRFFYQTFFIEQIPSIGRNRQHCFYQNGLWSIIFYVDGHSDDRANAIVCLNIEAANWPTAATSATTNAAFLIEFPTAIPLSFSIISDIMVRTNVSTGTSSESPTL